MDNPQKKMSYNVRFRDDSFHEPDPGSETENQLTYFLSTAVMFSNDEPEYGYYYDDEYADGSLVLVAIDPSRELAYKKWNIS
ncbi:hypothetical protein PG991_010202 [Apiospora marii]|uniref:Uncharacterized protein n=1 Tax=Apiospora marii TaxID=335849 RepID=A0ABR1RHS6_9PEZI